MVLIGLEISCVISINFASSLIIIGYDCHIVVYASDSLDAAVAEDVVVMVVVLAADTTVKAAATAKSS